MSAPRENVLLVPFRNVLLTGSGWGSGNRRSSDHDPGGTGPARDAEEGQEEADHATASSRRDEAERAPHSPAREAFEEGRRSRGDSRAEGKAVKPTTGSQDAGSHRRHSVGRQVPRLWANAGQRVPAGEARDSDWTRGTAQGDEPGGSVASEKTEARETARLARAQGALRRVG